MGKSILFKLDDVTKEYKMGQVTTTALKSASFEIYNGDLVVILGPSGSGKSTLLNLIGGMDRPTKGHISFNGKDISLYDDNQLTYFRRNNIGFVFQFYNLMPHLTVRENVELATEIIDNPLDIDDVLKQVGLSDKANFFPSQMSGGEQQRVAIARGVAKNPDVLLCDEPTGALDYVTGKMVLSLLKKINKQNNKSIILITHNQPIAQMADMVIRLGSGEIVEIKRNLTPLNPSEIEW